MLSEKTFVRIIKARTAKEAGVAETVPADQIVELVKIYESNSNWYNAVIVSDKVRKK
jgi:hypothetical protein